MIKLRQRKDFRNTEISYREWHVVDAANRETIVSWVHSPCEDLMEIHDSALQASAPLSSYTPSHPLQVRFIGKHEKGVFIVT